MKRKALDQFVTTFNQYYKDGSEEGTVDCRWFAAVYPIMRLVSYLSAMLTLNEFYYTLSVPLNVMFAVFFIAVQPYKKDYAVFNIVDAVIMLFIALFYAGITCVNTSSWEETIFLNPLFIFTCLVTLFPLAYMSALVLHWLYKLEICCFQCKALEKVSITESLPYRLAHPNNEE